MICTKLRKQDGPENGHKGRNIYINLTFVNRRLNAKPTKKFHLFDVCLAVLHQFVWSRL
jgi:hypothetical protein